tara:strand:- start:1487 stop:1681 length:195 start_codon:yes stop_codon:yes gene_type:complete
MSKSKQQNRCNVTIKIRIDNVPIGLATDEYWTYMEDDIQDGILRMIDHETLEAWYDEDHDNGNN